MALIDRDKELVQTEAFKIIDQHRQWIKRVFPGAPIWEILKRSSQVFDSILSLAMPVLGVGMTEQICLVALGSYGREEVCPHSDLDLLILYHEVHPRKIENFSARLLGLLWDQKIKVGHSLRTKEQCLKLAEKDNSVFTALLDARPVAGNLALYRELAEDFNRQAYSQRKTFFIEKYEELISRWIKFKNAIWVTEPQVMEGMGGLREWHLIRWFCRACLDVSAPEGLEKVGLADELEIRKIRQAVGRLFTLRTALHLLTGEKKDVLEIELQEDTASMLGLKSEDYRDPADALLKWFLPGSELLVDVLDRLLFELNRKFRPEKPEPVTGFSALEKEQGYLAIADFGFPRKLEHDPEAALSLFKSLANSGMPLAPQSRNMIASKVNSIKGAFQERMMELFAPDLKTSVAIRELKHIDMVRYLFPELETAFYLGQRDGYHSFTVGWHSTLCLEKIEEWEQEPEFGDDPEINWPVLKLAGLIHDLGKGSGGEHEEVGAQIALEVARRFRLDHETAELLKFLVAEHLFLNHYAYRRDFYDPKAIEILLHKIKDAARLKMLFILTCADIQAVGETSWSSWKDDLLRRLYHMLLAHLEKKETPSRQLSDRIEELKKLMLDRGVAEILLKELEKLPTRYLLGTEPEKIIEQLEIVDRRRPHETKISIKPLEKPRLEVVVVCDDCPGLFSDLSGALSSLNYNILSAEINTIGSTVLDIFVVEDLVAGKSAHWEQEIERRNSKLEQTLAQAISKEISVQELVEKKKGIFKPRGKVEIPLEVHFDQESSDQYTIIEVQAPDQPGLLYKITRNIFDHGLDIQFAKISTRADKVFDVFYLRDPLSKGKAWDTEIAKLVKALLASLKGANPGA